jgi:predicted ferric reductase
MNPQTWWYVARASGIVAWGLVTGSVVLGLWLSLRMSKKLPRPAWTLDLHRFIGGLAVVFTGVHLAGLVADSYVDFGVRELLVPFASGWQPGAVALGVVGVYLLVAIEVTSLLMKRLPRRFWRGVHFSSYALFVLATAHLLLAGTDASSVYLQWSALGACALVGFLTAARVLGVRDARTPRRPAQPPLAQPVVPPAPGAGSTVRTSTYTESSGDAAREPMITG